MYWCRNRQNSQNAVGKCCKHIDNGPVCAGWDASSVWPDKVYRNGWLIRSSSCRAWWRICCRSKLAIFWNWMSCGPSSISATTNAGCGQPCVGVLGKSSLLLSGIAVLPPADGCGWQAIPPAYRRCRTYTDFWKAYQAVLPKRAHHPVGKETGQTAHQERWYLTLRQRVSRFIRKTLSFSKSERNHELVTRWFIVQYHLSTSPIWVESECLKRYKR